MSMKCGRKTEVFSRVCGYYRPVAEWNRGKREEFRERRFFGMLQADRRILNNRLRLKKH
ncbi:anaerobic ribonucleoside-triphosphate reductase [Lentisphaerota bacterium ZTH]|nr:anaerobic ribonucleoside-triphosphate reductase [Lentisphaerota bacterium ZTH]